MDKIDISQAWQALSEHNIQIANLHVKEQFTVHPRRFSDFSLMAAGIFLDYSKNRITQDTMRLLCDLALATELPRFRDEMFKGEKINLTEKRAVLHTVLRNLADEATPEGKLVQKELKHMLKFVHDVHNGKWRGCTGKAITDVVNIGIGGSDLGPAMVVEALKPYAANIKVHFVSNLDSTHISETIKYLNPETTLFIIASKTFTTQETLANAVSAKEWLLSRIPKEQDAISRHFIGVTAKPERAVAFGIIQDNIFPFWDWVGGRFCLW